MINQIIKILLYIWQLPQNILGLLFYLFMLPGKNPRVNYRYKDITFYIDDTMHGGISLGNRVYFGMRYVHVDAYYDHEYGHTRDSKYWGPLYLLVIGLPSAIHAWVTNERNYNHNFYTERRANKLGGIEGFDPSDWHTPILKGPVTLAAEKPYN
jgi:hypothetical protein